MNLNELRTIVAGSTGSDWNNMPCWGAGSGPSYRQRVTADGSLLVEEHSNVCAYRHDLDITIAFGFNPDGDEHALHFGIEESLGVDDGSISKILVDLFYRGALVDREYLLYVDGGRGLLPVPSTRKRAYASDNADEWEHVVSFEKVAIARAIHSIELSPGDFDYYLNRSGYTVEG